MTVKNDRFSTVILGILLLFATLLFISFDILFGVCFSVLLCVLYIRYAMVFSKKLIIDESGCTVCFLFYKKQYRWDALTVRRVEKYSKLSGVNLRSRGGVIFSARQIKKPSWMNPAVYSFFVHPLSTFFLLFEYKRTKGTAYIPFVYEVDETEFRQKMREWNVTLQENTDKH